MGLTLPLSPAEPFLVRFNTLAVNAFTKPMHVLISVVLSIVWVRGRAGMPASTSRWVEINTAILVTSVLWLRLGRASYVRWREPLFAAFRLNGAGWGGGYAFVRLLLDRAAPAAASSRRLLAAVRRTAMVTAASSVLPMVVWWAIPLRIWLALPVQAAAVINGVTWNEDMCGAAPLVEPGMRALLHRAYTWGTAAHFSLAHGAPAALEPAQECAVVFGFLQLALGLALPAAGQLVVETALFEQHQRQRQRRGLPPEAGLQAALYRVAGELADAAEGPAVAVWLWMLLGLLWDAALLLVMRRPL